ncbi:Transposase DDE domain-containing protein [Deinococcus hopiensis KR-140]|uniref:Transposase DDE domain-containing protein n=1 Tax=Deinococcus hopiensis KR-140 TaxID=695939 RepID=A0A1W1VVT4_9DEIO|nr:Transposase DDE domain-containing protein [Deinococcus hopiensis KR-140]
MIRQLHRWAKRHFSDLKRFKHQKLTDALLVALLLARFVFKQPYPSIWWNMLREDRRGLPSYTQAYMRSVRLLDRLEALVSPAKRCAEVIIDSMPLPVCRPKRGKRCKFPGAKWGFGTQGDVYGYKLHAWVTPAGEIVQYLLKPANLHDTIVSYELNRRWPEFGGPKIIGDKGYCCLGYLFPPKKTPAMTTGGGKTATQSSANALKPSFHNWSKLKFAPFRPKRFPLSSSASSWPSSPTTSLSPKRRRTFGLAIRHFKLFRCMVRNQGCSSHIPNSP